MYYFLIIFFYNILQFIFDYYTKIYQINFIESLTTNICFKSFYLFNFLAIIVFALNNYEKYINKYFFEIPLKHDITEDLFKKINNMSELWLEQNSQTIVPQLVEKTQNTIYASYFSLIELYSSIIRVLINSYILYYIYPSFIYIVIPYFICYLIFYIKIIKSQQNDTQNDNKVINNKNIFKQNTYLTYYNSVIGNYKYLFSKFIRNLYIYINIYSLKILKRQIFYLGTLQLSQKILLSILLYIYMIHNCSNKCAIYFLPMYQTTITLVYQFEYILHNYYGYYNNLNELIDYNTFLETYNNEKKILYEQILLDTTFNYNLLINDTISYNVIRSDIIFDINLNLQNSYKYLLTGKTGIGKTTLCKIIAGHFNNCNIEISNSVLYIPQTVYLTFKDRTLLNIITQNDYNISYVNKELIKNIITNIVPFEDIINSFKNEKDWLNIKLEDKTFSGGQEKRIYLVMWLYFLINDLFKYRILILDEPDKGLDNDTFIKFINNLFSFNLLKDLCIIVVSHNLNIDKKLFTKYIELKKKDNTIIL